MGRHSAQTYGRWWETAEGSLFRAQGLVGHNLPRASTFDAPDHFLFGGKMCIACALPGKDSRFEWFWGRNPTDRFCTLFRSHSRSSLHPRPPSDPVVVLVLAIAFVFSVVVLHIIGKFARTFSK